jgi:hypothetical protein
MHKHFFSRKDALLENLHHCSNKVKESGALAIVLLPGAMIGRIGFIVSSYCIGIAVMLQSHLHDEQDDPGYEKYRIMTRTLYNGLNTAVNLR